MTAKKPTNSKTAVSKKTTTKKVAPKAVKKTADKVNDNLSAQEVSHIEHNTKTVAEHNKSKVDIFKKGWYDKKKKPSKDSTKIKNDDEPTYSSRLADVRYVRKRKRSKK